MEIRSGVSSGSGIAFGVIRRIRKKADAGGTVLMMKQSEKTAEERVREACDDVRTEYLKLAGDAEGREQPDLKMLFTAYSLVVSSVERRLLARLELLKGDLDSSWKEASEEIEQLFEHMEDSKLAQRALDVGDILKRVYAKLAFEESPDAADTETDERKYICVGSDLTPEDVIGCIDPSTVGFVLTENALYAHAAILANSLDVPILYGASVEGISDGEECILDGDRCLLILSPDEKTKRMYDLICDKDREDPNPAAAECCAREHASSILVCANIASRFDAETAIREESYRIGLLRSEFLLDPEYGFDEREHFWKIKEILDVPGLERLNIRLMDLGGDKTFSYEVDDEDRGIRYLFLHRELLMGQLRAIYRASVYGNVRILIPMVREPEEILEVVSCSRVAIEEVRKEGFRVDELPIGIMVETPEALERIDSLVRLSAFLNIGTNDLLRRLAERQQRPLTEAEIEDVLERIVRAGKRRKIQAAVCGQIAEEEALMPLFLRLQLDALSVSPGKISSIRAALQSAAEL